MDIFLSLFLVIEKKRVMSLERILSKKCESLTERNEYTNVILKLDIPGIIILTSEESKPWKLDKIQDEIAFWRNLRGVYDKFPDFFLWAFLLIVHTWNFSPLRSKLLRLQCSSCTVPTTSGRPHGSPLVGACHSLFHLLNCLITTVSGLSE